MPHVMRLAPTGWKSEHLQASESAQPYVEESAYSVPDKEGRSTWAKPIAQVYEVDPLICPRCSAQIRVLAAITEPEEVCKILRHPGCMAEQQPEAATRLVKIGRSDYRFCYHSFSITSARYPSTSASATARDKKDSLLMTPASVPLESIPDGTYRHGQLTDVRLLVDKRG
jgi:hypothetical protein